MASDRVVRVCSTQPKTMLNADTIACIAAAAGKAVDRQSRTMRAPHLEHRLREERHRVQELRHRLLAQAVQSMTANLNMRVASLRGVAGLAGA
eukprot:10508713-Alexandrium_andersonii.AAC.1